MRSESGTVHHGSMLLTHDENEQIYRLLGNRCQVSNLPDLGYLLFPMEVQYKCKSKLVSYIFLYVALLRQAP